MATTAYYASKISPNQFETPTEGYRICRSVRICRTGYQDYRGAELKKHPSYDPEWALDDSSTYRVMRPLSEVTSPATIASFDGKTIVDEHPPEYLAPGSLIHIDNERELSCGHMQNVRIGAALGTGEVPLIADLHIKDGDLIDKVDAGVRDVSCGYTYVLKRLGNGTFIQTHIRGNHIAVVPQGRAGRDISIQDSVATDSAIEVVPTTSFENPELEELIEDTDVEDLIQNDPTSGGIDKLIAGMCGGSSAAAMDRAMSTNPFAGVPYHVGKAKYEERLALDVNTPDKRPEDFYRGVPYHVGKAAHNAYLQARSGAARR
jgi:hypothetical protein